MATIFIIHGTFGNPEENWFPWLKQELEQDGHSVFVPAFPTPEHQSLENWLSVFQPYEQYIDDQTVFVGHSLGPAFILSILERLPHPVYATFFVAGFIESLNNPEFDMLNSTFVQKKFNWEKILKNCNTFYLFHSDNDPYVPTTASINLSEYIRMQSLLVPQAGHFNTQAGYTTFPLLLETIRRCII